MQSLRVFLVQMLYLQEIVVHRQLNMLTAGRSKELDADSCETEATEAFNCNIGPYVFTKQF